MAEPTNNSNANNATNAAAPTARSNATAAPLKTTDPAAIASPFTPDPAPRKGAKVNLVLADGKTVPAEVTKVVRTGKEKCPDLVDLVADYQGEQLVITGSPYDGDAKRPDSWHYPAEQASA
jgi:hypothetical protein